MIRRCTDPDVPAIERIVNEAAEAYRGVIPQDCWHEPYTTREELLREIGSGVVFSGWDAAGELRGVMGLQSVRDATLIRHAYVRPAFQGHGIGGALLSALAADVSGPLLVGTWAGRVGDPLRRAARIPARHAGPQGGPPRDLLEDSDRQRETSVVLERHPPA